MTVDNAFESAKTLIGDVRPRLNEIETEADARLQLINRFLTEILGWGFGDIKVEPHNPSGYTDYLLSAGGKHVFVIEAKRVGKALIDTRSDSVRTYKVSGPAIKSAYDGIEQAAKYSFEHGVSFAAVTTGVVWIAFSPFHEGHRFSEGKAYVFPHLDSIIENFVQFYDLFAKPSVSEKLYKIIFMKSEGLVVRKQDDYTSVIQRASVHLLPKSKLALDLDNVFRAFFGVMSGETDPEMLKHCFVETRESQQARMLAWKRSPGKSHQILKR